MTPEELAGLVERRWMAEGPPKAADPRYGKVHSDGSRSGGQPPTATGDEGLRDIAQMLQDMMEKMHGISLSASSWDAVAGTLKPIIRAREAAAHAAGVAEAIRRVRELGCPVCNGDCASANPPVLNCPMRELDAIERGQHKEPKPSEPVAYLQTMYTGPGQGQQKLSFSPANAFGDYSSACEVKIEPLYAKEQ